MPLFAIEAKHKSGKVGVFKRIEKRNGITRICLAILDDINIKLFPNKKAAATCKTKLVERFKDEYKFEVIPWPRLTIFGTEHEENEEFKIDGKWICGKSADLKTWNACEYFDFKYQAIQAAKRQINAHNKGKRKIEFEDVLGYSPADNDTIISFAVGQCIVPSVEVDGEDILENIAEGVHDQCSGCPEDYLDDVLDEHKKELEQMVFKWFERHNYLPNCYSINNVEMIII